MVVLALAAGLAAGSSATAAFIFRAGDSVWVDGKRYTWEEWKKIRDDPEMVKQLQPTGEAAPAAGPRAAACTTAIYYDEFPSDDEQFQCTAGLGALTREQILQKGWKVDFVEKIPPPAGQPAQSPRGLPLNLYKLVISRASGYEAPAPSSKSAAPARKRPGMDMLCFNDCLGSGTTKEFCEERCSY
ncbi:MAG TPA: hypothetical protein VE008_11785 [Burkholderiales bacterium]|nr:hypothetical protein [Burkholderiales bacterium]